jgi:dCMP deaminase
MNNSEGAKQQKPRRVTLTEALQIRTEKEIFDNMFEQVTAKTYLEAAYKLALNSPDPSTQNGAVLVRNGEIIGEGWNAPPSGVKLNDERLVRPYKYHFFEHAERNAIFSAARKGECTVGATLYCPFIACVDCGRAIIQAGIKKVVGHLPFKPEPGDRWYDSCAISFEMLEEAGVEVVWYDGKIGAKPVLYREELIEP